MRLTTTGRPSAMSQESRANASRRMTGAGSPKFRGHRTTGGDGRYVLVRPPADYPFPDSIGRRGYIREHRMVMELHLGRALTASEVVHHRNHDTRDNRLENLEIYDAHAEHMGEEWGEGTFDSRWPACVFGCGRQAKPFQGVRWHGCHRCRRLARYRGDPRTAARD